MNENQTYGELQEKIDAALLLLETGPTTEDRILGIQRLASLGARHDIVRRGLWSRNPRIRRETAAQIGAYQEETDFVELERLTSDDNDHVRRAACLGLGRGHFLQAVDLLRRKAEDCGESPLVRSAAIESMARLTEHPDTLDVAREIQDAIPKAAFFRVLGLLRINEARDELMLHLRQAIEQGNLTERESRQLVSALLGYEHDEDLLDLLVQSLGSLPGARTISASALGQARYEPARSALEKLTTSPKPKLAAQATLALCQLGVEESKDFLWSQFSRDDAIALQILNSLTEFGSIPIVEELARNGPTGLRSSAICALAKIDPESGLRLASEMTSDENPRVRLEAFKLKGSFEELSDEDLSKWRSDSVMWVASEAPDDLSG